ncbi:MAG: glycosyltransferase family 9 protein [Smithellaceae bacterium]
MRQRQFLPKPPKKILVIAPQRIGDVLLTTPVFRSLRQAYRDVTIDIVVFEGTDGCISANKDIDHIITIKHGATFLEQIITIRNLFRKYDLAISPFAGDRPIFYSWIAGKSCMGLVENGYKNLWKRLLLDKYELFDNHETHTVTMNLSLLKYLGVKQISEVTAAWTDQDEIAVRQLLPFDMEQKAYAIVHIYPMFSYKMWNLEGWGKLINWLNKSKGLEIVLTGGNSSDELEYISLLRQSLSVSSVNVAGKTNLGGVAYLLNKASVYVGLDTAVTHMAAALGIPTIALYGPTNPVKWGPLPNNLSFSGKSPYKRKGSQIVKNVFLLQGQGECVPCHEEGCDRNVRSFSKCLLEIPADDVTEAVETMLTR